MINKVKKFLTARRCKKLLKNNKGFSLLEVLVAVTIIGIVAGIAIPRFANYRDSAALTAAASTGQNVAKAYNLCTATKSACSTLANLNIACETCKTPLIDGTTAFCVNMEQTISNKIFRSCVHVNKSTGAVVQHYGGEFKFCKQDCKTTTPSNCTSVGDTVIIGSSPKRCDSKDDCTIIDTTNFENKSCGQGGSSAGKCTTGTGVCAGAS